MLKTFVINFAFLFLFFANSGERDLICNHVGTEYLISNMTWNNIQGFDVSLYIYICKGNDHLFINCYIYIIQGAEQKEWYINDKVVGSYTEARGLTYVLIKDGSHMVPYDKPVETLDMINRFMGIGDNSVKGLTSRVGKPSTTDTEVEEEDEESKQQPVVENEDLESSLNDNGEENDDDEEDDDDEDKENEKENDSETNNSTKTQSSDEDHVFDDDEDKTSGKNTSSTTSQLTDYAKSNGSYGALVLLLIVVVAGGCWYKSKTYNDDNRNRSPSRQLGLWDKLQQLFGNNKNNDGTKLRLADQDEANEL